MKKFVQFSNGQQIPIVGLGMWQTTDPAELETAVDEALTIGYRHFDTAYNYLNEEIFGRVLKKWFDSGEIKREELFITTKLPAIAMQPDKVETFLKKSLTLLQLDYVDLYLIHTPVGLEYISDKEVLPIRDGKLLLDKSTNLENIWKEMENQVDAGRTKSIGLSNFNSKQIERLVNISRIRPSNLQVEANAYFQQKPLREFCAKYGITVCAYAPLGSPGRKMLYEKRGMKVFHIPQILLDPIVVNIAEKYKRTPAQILLRFLAQQNIVVIPKSVTVDRLKENMEIFDFELQQCDMDELFGLDKGSAGRSFDFAPSFKEIVDHPEYAYKIPY